MTTVDGRIRVLWLAKGLGPGGMERLLVNHARFGDRSEFDYAAAYLVERPDSVIGELDDLGVRSVRLTPTSDLDPRWPLRLRALVDRCSVDVVHVHSPFPAALARPVLRLGRRRPQIVYTEHNTWDCYGRGTRFANCVTYPLDDKKFAVSHDAAASAPRPLRGGIEQLTHGIDLDAARAQRHRRAAMRDELGVSDDTVVIATVANLRTEKGYDVLLDAAAEVLAADDHVVFLAMGHGPLAEEMAARRNDLGLGDRFRFLGFRNDALAVLAASDVFTLASRQEGLPLSYMESTALGLPAVVTAVGGLPDFVEDGRNGRLVPPGDAASLAAALLALVGDPALRRHLGDGAATTAPQFDARLAVQRQEAVYRELVA